MNCKQTKTGDLMQVSECNTNGITYGVISIKLKNSYPALQQAETVLLQFMHQLQPTFGVLHTTGALTACERGKATITDYWQDVEGMDWKVKGWTDGRTIAVLYIKNIAHVPVSWEARFLNGTFFKQP